MPAIRSRGFPRPAVVAAVTIALLAAAWSSVPPGPGSAGTTSDGATAVRVARDYGKLPVSFEPNRGQSDPRVRFLARGNGYGVFLTDHEAVLSLRGKGSSATAVRIRALAANSHPEVVGERLLPGRVNYLRGRDPRGWQTGLPSYGAVRYRGLYPGIDQIFYGSQGRLEYDYIVAPAADPGRIGLTFAGAKKISVDRGGDLLLAVAGGTVRQPRPFAYQEVGAERDAVDVRYVLDGSRVSFAIGRYDRSRPLVIDPKIEYSTYLGGDSDERGTSIAVDGEGSAYVTGYTHSADFPATPSAVQPAAPEPGASWDDGYDVFVTKLNRSGSALEYSTYLGGRGADFGEDIAVDGRGRAYVVGSTRSNDFPTTPGAFQSGDPDPVNGGSDAFVAKLSSDGTYLKYSTYLGGRGHDVGSGIAVDGDERAYVTGFAGSADFPTTADAVQPSSRGGGDAFVTKLSREGTELKYSTYLGGSSGDGARDIAVDTDKRAYVTGIAYSADFPTTRGAFRTEPGDGAVFVTKLSREGTELKYSTYLDGQESAGIAVDREQRAYVTGTVYHADGDASAFVTKLSREGTDVKYSTYLGGGGEVYAGAIAVDLNGRAYVTGRAYGGGFPTTPDAVQPAPPEPEWDWNAFVAKLNTDGSTKYATYLGETGPGYSYGFGTAVDDDENFYVTGLVVSIPPDEEGWYTKFPTTSAAFQTAPGGSGDAFVTKFGP